MSDDFVQDAVDTVIRGLERLYPIRVEGARAKGIPASRIRIYMRYGLRDLLLEQGIAFVAGRYTYVRLLGQPVRIVPTNALPELRRGDQARSNILIHYEPIPTAQLMRSLP